VNITCRVLLMSVLLAMGCAEKNPVTPDSHQDWVASLIRRLETQPVANPPAFIARYAYRGRIVYYLPAQCCDVWSTLYQADGAILCHPDGGFAGGGDGRCPAFFAERTNEQIVWRDPRSPW
jgi:Domain of unknown function (DUF6970)